MSKFVQKISAQNDAIAGAGADTVRKNCKHHFQNWERWSRSEIERLQQKKTPAREVRK